MKNIFKCLMIGMLESFFMVQYWLLVYVITFYNPYWFYEILIAFAIIFFYFIGKHYED